MIALLNWLAVRDRPGNNVDEMDNATPLSIVPAEPVTQIKLVG
jgi:hypothetical protein